MPWKNGGGETREILVSPPGAGLDALDWRISLASIASDGPFSAFQGIERTLCVIRGAGIRLQVANAAPELLLENSAPYTFAGESPASSTLVAGATVDLNVMSRRERFRHAVTRLSITNPLQLRPTASSTIVFCQHGSLQCEADGTVAALESEDCVVLDNEKAPVSLTAAGTAVIVLIELFEEPAATRPSHVVLE
ncbi:HutD/Ves family protein [Peristeroidobacter agariperforans]|uniref:HutD/Ves family protein n=1 Tax=Peristeroidobacter agariperforans TaxID=268404 RepID=UPI00130077F7